MPPVRKIDAPGIKVDGILLNDLRREVAGLLGRGNLAFPGAQPVSFARRHIEQLKQRDYYLCEKTDGFRYLLYITTDEFGDEIQYLIDRKNDYWFIPKESKLHFPKPQNIHDFNKSTILDGELVLDREPNGKMQPRYMVFDCMVLNERVLMQKPLDKRLAYCQEEIMKPYKALLEEYPQEIPYQHFLLAMKAFEFAYAIQAMFMDKLPKLRHGNDGLVFTCRETEYQHGTDQNILKWKPENENSIDFRLSLDWPMIQPDKIDIADGIREPYPDYDAMPICNLYTWQGDGRPDQWFAVLSLSALEWDDLKSRDEPLDDRIVECYMDEKKQWRYMKPRDDKPHANHQSTVDSVLESITDRVTKEDLLAAENEIKHAWKARAAGQRALTSRPPPQQANGGVKRKADEQGNGRPSPAPPGKRD